VSDLTALITSGKILSEYNTDEFAFGGIQTGKPGVRYYNYIGNGGIFDADNGDKTVLFTHVIVPIDWNNAEIFTLDGSTYEVNANGSEEVLTKGTGYQILITGEAIQSAEMADAATAFLELDAATGVTRE